MLQADPQNDPLVEILRLAYRRGLVVLQEQGQGQPVNGQEVDAEIQIPESTKNPCEEQSNQTGSGQ